MARIETRLYLYDLSQESNNYRGQNLSAHVLQGDEDQDNLDDTADKVEITLAGITIEQKENPRAEFMPKTKFIYEKWEEVTDDLGNKEMQFYKDWHLCVSNDTVSQPILSDNNYFDHHITFAEPVAEAQGRLVSNMAVTYRLKDVTLQTSKKYDVEIPTSPTTPSLNAPTDRGVFGRRKWNSGTPVVNPIVNEEARSATSFQWRFPDWYQIDGKTPTWTGIKLYQEIPQGVSSMEVGIPIPLLRVLMGMNKTTDSFFVGYASIEVIVERAPLGTTSWTRINNLNNGTNVLNIDPAQNRIEENMWNTKSSWGLALSRFLYYTKKTYYTEHYTRARIAKVSQLGGNLNTNNRKVRISVQNGYTYRVSVRRRKLSTPSGYLYNESGYTNYFDLDSIYPVPSGAVMNISPEWEDAENNTGCGNYSAMSERNGFWVGVSNKNEDPIWATDSQPLATIQFNAVTEGAYSKLFVAASPPANALDIFNKAQLLTQNHLKISGIKAENTPKSFYLSTDDSTELENTQVVENFYVQKNLWEIFMDIGKYIHARPHIRFGSAGRFLVTWKRYGLTQQFEQNANPITIYNARFVEEFVAACSSYVSNMVQLGGIIKETVSPKSSSEDRLVYNDVAEIEVSKGIIEIVDMVAINKVSYGGYPAGTRMNMIGKQDFAWTTSGFVFEASIWNLLPADTSVNLNKGIALYYQLGDNRIQSLNYRLPTVNPGDLMGDYSIKKILGIMYYGATTQQQSNWKNIKVNDFLFEVTYRTKDDLRTHQTRPDFRKYLLSTPFDRVPIHEQFNNQQDVLVDSLKYGNNVYGMLIRTGNTVYTMREWVDSVFLLKTSGQLYNLNGELFYVSRVKNTYFADHIISEIEFSKDFNRLSQIIGIPSEPRFYEISEQSLVDRPDTMNDYLMLGTKPRTYTTDPNVFIRTAGWQYIRNLLFVVQTKYPKYAISVFKSDQLTPDMSADESFVAAVVHPVSTYSIQNTLTIDWGMVDNFSAGDRVEKTTNKTPYSNDPSVSFWTFGLLTSTNPTDQTNLANMNQMNTADTAYYKLVPVRYKSVTGRAALLDFAILTDLKIPASKTSITSTEVGLLERLPKIFVSTEDSLNPDGTSTGITLQGELNKFANDGLHLFGNQTLANMGLFDRGIISLYDNREVPRLNYNLQMITDSDRFVLSSYMWQQDKGVDSNGNLVGGLFVGLMNEEINKISNESLLMPVVVKSFPLTPANVVVSGNSIQIRISSVLGGEDLSTTSAIVIFDSMSFGNDINSSARYFVCGRNIGGLDINDPDPELRPNADWFISSIDKNDPDIFTKQ